MVSDIRHTGEWGEAMSMRRIARVEQLLKRELSEIVQRGLKDPRIGFVTVTRIKVSPDLKQGRAFVSVMGDEQEKERTMSEKDHIQSLVI